MTENAPRWSLESLVDFEYALATKAVPSVDMRASVAAAVRGLDGAAARRAGLRVWLDGISNKSAGRKFAAGLGLAGAGLAIFMLVAGASSAIGLLDHERGGINVTLFLAILLGVQWLVLLVALIAWLVRHRAADGFSMVQSLVGKLARKLAGHRDDAWWHGLMNSGGTPRAAMLWRLARLVQAAGMCFNIGIIAGLAGLVLLKHVGFFWETTTDFAMRTLLGNTVKFLSAPWAAWWPDAVPSDAVIDATRWLPGRSTGLAPGPGAWWEFLLGAVLVWGFLPRAILWLIAFRAERSALANLDFQGRHQRILWREITGPQRIESDEKPLDGVLVLDVGGSGLTADTLRPFLLQRLRVHPAAWASTAVLDEAAEAEASKALAAAPAGVVLLAEGWSLAPARMKALHTKIRATAGPDKPVKFLIANASADHLPVPANAEERHEWANFVDSLRDPEAEVFFYSL